MSWGLRFWQKSVPSQRLRNQRSVAQPARRLWAERLEDRTLLSGDTLAIAAALPFTALRTAHAASLLTKPDEVDLYRVSLETGDQVSVGVSAQTTGSGLQSWLRIFGPNGQQLARDRQDGGDPRLTFQAASAGSYFVGISSAGNDAYDPTAANSGHGGATTGLYALDLRRTVSAPLLPDLAGGSFRLGTETAAWGETVPVSFTVENRGGADAGPFDVQILLASNPRFDPSSSLVLPITLGDSVRQTFALDSLAAGQAFSSDSFTITLPNAASAQAQGVAASGPVYLGLRIDPAGAVSELNRFDQSGVHRGSDWAILTIVTPLPTSVSDLSLADPNLNTRATGALVTPDQVDSYSFSVSGALGSGRLTAEITPTAGTLVPRLTLSGANGQVLIQSDARTLTQHLQPGKYSLSVSAQAGTGAYQLTSQFVQANPPFDPVVAVPARSSQGYSVAVADVNGDGRPDLVVANPDTNTVSVLLGNGDGTFAPPRAVTGGSSVAVVDVNGDGKPDLVVTNFYVGTVSVLPGNGDGTFGPPQTFATSTAPSSVAVADIDGDGRPDLVVASASDNTVSMLPGNGDGTFGPPQALVTGSYPRSVAVADVNGDGSPDLVIANALPTLFDYGIGRSGNLTVRVLLGNGDGTFGPPQAFATGSTPSSVAVADVNGDGRPDLVVANTGDNTVSALLNKGDGSFTFATPLSGVGLRNTPLLADLNRDHIPDSVVLNRAGHILLRKGLPGSDNRFTPPVTLNDPAHLGRDRPARDLAVMHFGVGWAIAMADALPDPTLSSPSHPFVYTVSLYRVTAQGWVTRSTAFSTTRLPTRIAAADLTGSGLDDLIIANSLDNSIQVAFQQADGTFSPAITLSTGAAPSDISVVDVNGDGLPDIVVSNQVSGDVSVFLNDQRHSFSQGYRFRAGTSLYGLDTTSATPAVSSEVESVSLAAGDFTGSGRADLVVVNRGTHSFSVLSNDGRGGFADPQAALTTSTSDGLSINEQPGPAVAGDFHAADGLDSQRAGKDDVAILMEDRGEVWIYTNQGHGTFMHTFSIAVGSSPTGLSKVRNPSTGFLDLLVVNPFGDILHLQGRGDGTFQLAGNRVSLAVQDLKGNGQPDVLLANQQTNRVTIQTQASGNPQFVPVQTLTAGPQTVALAPGAVQWAKLDKGSSLFDAVVMGSGSNDVLVYRASGFDATGQPTFAPPVSYPVGTAPVGLTIQDINGDGVPGMLIADQGSNDIATLFGSWDPSGHWVGTPGPRLNSGGLGPVATTLRDMNGDGIPDLVVTNGQSGNLTVLPGRGNGFFDDRPQSVQTLDFPGNPVIGAPTFVGASSVGVVPTADGRLMGFDLNNFAATVSPVFIPPVGEGVNAVQALADGNLVAALDGGTVAELHADPVSGLYSIASTFEPLTGIPSDPSALDVLETASGLQILVTNVGEDQVFVFVPEVPSPAVVPPANPPSQPPGGPAVTLAEPPPSSGFMVEVTSSPEAPLTLVVTLIAGITPAGQQPLSAEAATVVAPESADQAPVTNTAALPTGLGGGDELDDSSELAGPLPGGVEGGINVEEKLRQLDLYDHARNPDQDGGISRRPARLANEWEPVLAILPTVDGLPTVSTGTQQQPSLAQKEAEACVAVVPVPDTVEPSTLSEGRGDSSRDEEPAQSASATRFLLGPIGVVTESHATSPTAEDVTDAVFSIRTLDWELEGIRVGALMAAGLAIRDEKDAARKKK
jgi:hypothetical protein